MCDASPCCADAPKKSANRHTLRLCLRKGKKDGKQEAKADKESDVEKAKAAAALWELRLNVADQSLVRHREDWRALARVNEELTNRLHRLERDTVDISACLQRKDAAKEQEVGQCLRQIYMFSSIINIVCVMYIMPDQNLTDGWSL